MSGDESSIAVSALQMLSTGVTNTSQSSMPATPERLPRSIEVSTPNATNVTPNVNCVRQSAFPLITIDTIEWNQRIQDVGGDKQSMPAKTYKSKQIPPYGPNKLFYYGLSSIAIDYLIAFKNDTLGWSRIPKNMTDVKKKILELILSMRTKDGVKFELDQERFLYLLHNQWGGTKRSSEVTCNDKLRVFGLIMNHESNKYILRRLSEGIKDREMLDDAMYKPKEMFQNISFDFNNEAITVNMPSGSEDIDGIEEMDPNDSTRIQILRDGMKTYFSCVN